MGCEECLDKISEKCEKIYADRITEEKSHYDNIKIGLPKSMSDIDKSLEEIKNWDELMNIEEKSSEETLLLRSKTIKAEKKGKKCCFFVFGLIFCLIHLIGVQAGIIILNSLFGEIVEEFKLWLSNTPREYNFYEKLEINTYRELPEIDVGMVTSSIGILVLKEIGFKKTNSIFQLLSSVLFALLFILFHFHTKEKLLENYNHIEIFVLVISYIVLSFLVGSSSTLALKELFNVTNEIYYKEDKMEKSSEKNIILCIFWFIFFCYYVLK